MKALLLVLVVAAVTARQESYDISWREFSDLVHRWVLQQSEYDQRNLNAFYAKIVRIFERFEGILEDNKVQLSPEASAAYERLIALINDPDIGFKSKMSQITRIIRSLDESTSNDLNRLLKNSVADYGNEYGNPLLGPDSILGKQF